MERIGVCFRVYINNNNMRFFSLGPSVFIGKARRVLGGVDDGCGNDNWLIVDAVWRQI